jgi:AraC-like DNA-binding protein
VTDSDFAQFAKESDVEYFMFPDLRTVHADNGGCAILSPGWSHPRRRLGSSVLILGVRGHVPIIDGENEHQIVHDVGPGTVTLLPAERVHFGPQPLESPAMYYWFHFRLAESPMIIQQPSYDAIMSDADIIAHRLDGAALLPLSFRVPDPEPQWNSFRELLFEQENRSYTRLKFQILFQRLIIALAEYVIAAHRPGRPDVGPSGVAYSVVTWMSEHLTDPNLSIKTIADAVGLNPDYAGRRFREVMGLSVGEYLLKKRVELAIKRLQETNDNVQQIAESCGFGSVRHFLRQFKVQQGATPSEVRHRHQIMHVNSL